MAELLGLILAQAGMAHLIRFNQRLGADPEVAGFVQYATAAALAAVWWAATPGYAIRWEEAACGVVVGSMGVTGYFLFNSGMQMAGVSIMQSIGRLSIAIPVAASIWIWREVPTALQSWGLLLVAVAVPLLARTSALRKPRQSAWKIAVLLAHFFAMGAMGLAYKAYLQAVPEGAGPGLYLVTFLCSGTVTAVPWIRRPRRVSRRDAVGGAALGLANFANKVFTVLALGALPGIVVFPVSTAGTIVLSTLLSMVLWDERYGPRAITGFLAALAAILAIQLGG